MADSLGRRIFLSHLELSYRLGRRVTLAEFGEMIAGSLHRTAPFTAAAVSRWESGAQEPTARIVEAISAVTLTDPGWISHGERSAAPRPPRLDGTVGAGAATPPGNPITLPIGRKLARGRRA